MPRPSLQTTHTHFTLGTLVDLYERHGLHGPSRQYQRKQDGVAQGTIHGDVNALNIALNWAISHRRADGSFLLDANPLDRYQTLV